MTEVDDFTQTDLDEEDVMLLDTWEEVRAQRALNYVCKFRNLSLVRKKMNCKETVFSGLVVKNNKTKVETL